MKKRIGLTSSDARLWAYVARSARPLPGRILPPVPVEPPITSQDPVTSTLLPPDPPPIPKKALKPLVTLDRRARRDVARGQTEIDARIDLHGMRQAEAHRALLAFLYAAHARNHRLVLVITGKGTMEGERGVLRRMVPHWIADPVLRRIVIGFEPAAIGHGGDGALYVRIRRER